jgi:DNA polymerase-3 subunit beta
MKIVLSSTVLSDAVKMLSQALNRKNALPILGDFHFDVNGKEVTITASDSEVTLQRTLVCQEESLFDGKFCVSATQLRDALVGISEQPITLDADVEHNSFKVIHATGETYFAITSPIADEYPMPAQQKYTKELTVESPDLYDAINRCLWATAKDENRPNLGGVYFDIDGDSLTVVASNGMCIVKTELFVGADIKGGFILPKKAAMILAKQAKGPDLHISFNNQWVQIEADYFKLHCRQVEGKYPNYNSVIPEEHNCTYQAKLKRLNLINIVRKIEPFTIQSGTTSRVALIFGAEGKGQLEVRGDDYDMSMGAFDTMSIEDQESCISEPLTIGINGNLLEQALKSLNDLYVTFYTFGESKPIVIKDSDVADDAPQITALIMPVLLND